MFKSGRWKRLENKTEKQKAKNERKVSKPGRQKREKPKVAEDEPEYLKRVGKNASNGFENFISLAHDPARNIIKSVSEEGRKILENSVGVAGGFEDILTPNIAETIKRPIQSTRKRLGGIGGIVGNFAKAVYHFGAMGFKMGPGTVPKLIEGIVRAPVGAIQIATAPYAPKSADDYKKVTDRVADEHEQLKVDDKQADDYKAFKKWQEQQSKDRKNGTTSWSSDHLNLD